MNTITPENPIKVLIISPLYDIPTMVSYRMAKQLARVLNSHELIEADHLNPIFTTPKSIERSLLRKHYPLIIYYGHGKKDVWYHGIWNRLADNSDSELFKGSIVTTMACYSAEIFGEQLVKSGALAYIGNTNEVFGAFNLIEYPYATDFVRIWQNEAVNLLRGWTVKRCVEDTKNNLYGLALKYRADPKLLNGDMYAKRFEFNAVNHIFRGDGNARLPAIIQHQYELNIKFLQ